MPSVCDLIVSMGSALAAASAAHFGVTLEARETHVERPAVERVVLLKPAAHTTVGYVSAHTPNCRRPATTGA